MISDMLFFDVHLIKTLPLFQLDPLDCRYTIRKTKTSYSTEALNRFLQGIEKKAYRIALLATGHREEALDIVQEAMLKLTEKYHRKPAAEWPPIFHRILQSKIQDWHRKNTVRNRWRQILKKHTDDDQDPLEQAPAPITFRPDGALMGTQAMDTLDWAIHNLPLRQQQAFLLRLWEGFDTKETAKIMKCSEGSVKTHYSRALKALQTTLKEYK